MKRCIKFPKIGRFRNIISSVSHTARFKELDENNEPVYSDCKLPVLTFIGKIKLHGTNSGVSFNNVDGIWVQSRIDIITSQKDNAGFAFFAESHEEQFRKIFNQISRQENIDLNELTLTIYGEWVGCFTYTTPILLADGTKIPIGKIVNEKLNVEVMSYNQSTGDLEPKRIVDWHKNGRSEDWIKIKTKRRKRGGKSTAIICTPNHKIFVNDNGLIIEKSAGDLMVGDCVFINCNVLRNNLKEFLMGSLLGDASFSSKRGISISHSDDNQKFYNDFIKKIFRNVSSTHKRISGLGSNMRVHSIHVFPEIEDFYDELHKIKSSKKIPTIDYLNKLSPIALAAWYMDDGSLAVHNGENRQPKACFHVEGFGSDSVEMISLWFNSRGFECNIIVNSKNRKELRLSPLGTSKLLYQIAPYVLKGFNYKLPKNMHGIRKIDWWNHTINEYDNSILSTKIESIEAYVPKENYQKERYDISIIDNNNYFANNILVHNSGIQKGMGVNKLDEKSMFIFGIKVSKVDADPEFVNYWLNCSGYRDVDSRIYNINDYPTYTIEIDFNDPKKSQEELNEITNNVEKQCPVASAFYCEGIGEGIVWSCDYEDSIIRFKVKGEKHKGVKREKKELAPIDVEKLKSINEFVKYAVTENRLDQGIENVFGDKELDIKKLGDFLKWINSDILSEEMDVLVKNGLEIKDVSKEMSNKGRDWFLNKYNNF